MPAASIFALILTLAGFRAAHAWLFAGPGLSEADYRRSVLLARAARRWRLALPAAVLTLPALAEPARTSWAALGDFEPLRWLATGLAAVFAWSGATYTRNLFLGQTHGLDRLVLVGLAVGSAAHPGFLPVFLLLAVLLMRQFEHPSCMRYSFTHARLPLDMLLVFALWPAAVLCTAAPPETLALLLVCTTAASYFEAGLTKARLGPYPGSWALHNRLHRLLVSARVNGWLGRTPEPTVIAAACRLAPLDRPMALATLALELGAAAMMTDRRVAVVLLAGAFAMHAAIFAVSGINFWKWAAADLLLAWIIWSLPTDAAALLFTPGHLAASAAVLATASLHLRPPRLGWLDTRLNSSFRIELIGQSGAVSRVHPLALAPYDMVFAQGRHFHLCPRPVLTHTYGTTPGRGPRGWALHTELEATGGDPAAIERLRAAHGRTESDERRSRELDRFMRAFFEVWPRAGPGWWSVLAAPKHIYSSAPRPAARCPEPVRAVRIRFVETWFDGHGLRTLSDRVVREIGVRRPEARAPDPRRSERSEPVADEAQHPAGECVVRH